MCLLFIDSLRVFSIRCEVFIGFEASAFAIPRVTYRGFGFVKIEKRFVKNQVNKCSRLVIASPADLFRIYTVGEFLNAKFTFDTSSSIAELRAMSASLHVFLNSSKILIAVSKNDWFY